MWRIPPPPQPSTPSWQALRQLFSDRKSISNGIQPKPPQVRAGPKTAVAARELQRREGHLVAAESWGDRASDRLGRRQCQWLDVRAPRQHPRAVCSGLSCATPTSPAILFLRRDHDARPDRLQAAREDRPDVWGCCPGRGGRPARVCARAAAVLLHSSAEAHELRPPYEAAICPSHFRTVSEPLRSLAPALAHTRGRKKIAVVFPLPKLRVTGTTML